MNWIRCRAVCLNVPFTLLLLLLQRTPVLKVLASAEFSAAPLASHLVRILAVTAASLGAYDTVAGATTLTTNPATPVQAKVGQSFTMAYSVTGAPSSTGSIWFKSGLPPGLKVKGIQTDQGYNFVNSGYGTIDGTPTTAGTYNVNIVAFEFAYLGGFYKSFTFEIDVAPAPVSPPTISTGPASETVKPGDDAFFYCSATGSGTLSYQWSKDGTPISGATSRQLFLQSVGSADKGNYTVTVTNSGGSVTSSAATLALDAGVYSHLINISSRANVSSGDNIMICGFVVSGSGSKQVLLRGGGPSLSSALTNYLPNPKLQLVKIGTGGAANQNLDANDNWEQATNLASLKTATLAVGAPMYSTGSNDASILDSLNPGVYTFLLTSADTSTGIALGEVFDADANPATSGSHIVNLSTRAYVGTGSNVLIAGFVVQGTGAKRVLIQAVGPGLNGQVTNPLSDPTLTLYKGQTAVFTNDNWGDEPNVSERAAVVSAIGARTLAAGSKDSAMLVTLNPGAYTAIVSGVGGATGTGVVEVYDAQ